MDRTVHTDKTLIITYVIMAFAFAGKFHATLPEMLLAAFSCLFEGIIMTQFPKLKLNGYISRFASGFVGTVVIIIFSKFMVLPKGYMPIILYMVLPAVAGATTVDGLCSYHEGKVLSKLKVVPGNFASIAAGVTVALLITGAGYVR